MTARRYPWQASPPAASPTEIKPPAIVAPIPRITLSPREAAAALGVGLATLTTWQRAGNGPPSFTAPDGRRRLYPVAELAGWAADQARAAAETTLADEPRNGDEV